jgi:copper transport protein
MASSRSLSLRERVGARAGPLPALLAALLLALLPSTTFAHANLERSIPAPSTVVVEQPRAVSLYFSEEPELRLTELRLLDPAGRLLQTLPPRPVPGDSRAVQAALPELQPGTVVVVWRTTSAVDGHTTQGAVPFTYGLGQIPQSVDVGLSGTPVYTPQPLAVFARALTFAGVAGLVGGLAFGPLVLGPALAALPGRRGRRRADGPTPVEASATRALTTLGLVAAGLLIVGTALHAIAQAAEAAGVGPREALGEPLQRAMLGTRYGSIFGARLLLALALALLTPLAAARPTGRLRWVALALAAGLLLTLSLGSHAAAVPQLTSAAVALDWLHVGAASVWVGGLAQLCFLAATLTRLPPGRDIAEQPAAALALVVQRFSAMLPVVAVIAVTGVVQSLIHVGLDVRALDATPYGQTLLLKVALVAAMGMLGIVHWRMVGPRMRALAAVASRATADALVRVGERFRWTALAETALGVAVLVATGLLTAQQPGRDAAVALRHVTATGRAEGTSFELTLTPGEAGLNRYELELSPAPRAVEKVVLRATHQDMQMGEQEVELREVEPGRYVAEGGHLSMFGRWNVTPIVRVPGQSDARVDMAVRVDEPLSVRLADAPPPIEITTPMVVGAQGVIFGVIVIIAAGQLRRRAARAALAALLIGCGAVGFGGYTAASAFQAQSESVRRVRSPVPIDDAALAQGRALYQQHCLSCHGFAGRGDGPLGRTLNPRPADLRIHVTEHPEGQLYAWVTNGVPGTAMPAFRDLIPEDDRWRVVAFIRGFSETGPAPAQTAVAQLQPATPAKPGAPASKP